MMITKYKSSLKIAHLNIQSINNKFDQLKHFLYSHQIDIMSLNETFLNSNKQLFIEDYNIIRRDRLDRRGGGVCLLIHNSILHTRLDPDEFKGIEHVTICINSESNEKILISSYYNPPKTKINNEFLIFLLCSNFILLGDLNSHHRLWGSSKDNHSGYAVSNFISTHGTCLLNLMNPKNTYEKNQYGSVLDLAITTNYIAKKVKEFDVTDELQSDHLTIVVTLACKGFSKALKKFARNKHTIKCFDGDKFSKEISHRTEQLLFDPPSTRAEIDSLSNNCTKIIQDSHHVSAFEKEIFLKRDPIFLPKEIMSLIRRKRMLNKHLQREYDFLKKKEFNFLSREIKNKIIEHKQKRWQNFCDSLNDFSVSDSKLWNKIKSVDSSNPTSRACPKLLINGNLSQEESQISDAFATNLEEVFTDNTDPKHDTDWFNNVNLLASTCFSNPEDNAEQMVSVFELKELIKKIRGKGAPGPDGISNKLIKLLPDNFLFIIKLLFDASIKLSYIPRNWKNANVIMIPKPKKKPQDINSYRPISLLNTLSKLLEKVIQSRLNVWLNSNNILVDEQCGFRKNRGTKEQHLRLVQTCQQSFNRNQHVGVLFFDIEKAFDRVWINGLVFKLHRLKIPNYLGRWLVNYLSERSFQVKLNSVISCSKQIRAGVPQGSILGPTLFNIFFNDVCDDIKKIPFTTEALYADDLAIWTSSEHELTIQKTLQCVSNAIHDWSLSWRTKISTNKTVFTIFSRKHSKKEVELFYNNQPLKHDPNPTFLGITFDKMLLFDKHTDNLVLHAERRLNMLVSMKGKTWGMSAILLIITYKVLIRSLFDYSSTALFNTSKKNIKKISIIQNKALRKAFYWPPHTSTSQMLAKANLSSTNERLAILSVKFLNKAIFYDKRIIVDLFEEYIKLYEINEGAIKTKKGGGINKTFFGKVIDLPPEILNERKLTLK